jgi:hypothetical protein
MLEGTEARMALRPQRENLGGEAVGLIYGKGQVFIYLQ